MDLAVAALIATYRRPREIERLFASLAKIERGLALVVVVDNAGCAETQAIVRGAPFPTELVIPGENAGCGGGLRLAGETALRLVGEKCTHLLVLDDDAVVAPDTLEVLAAAGADAACPLVTAATGKLGWTPGFVDRHAHRISESLHSIEAFREQIGTRPVPLVWTQGICLLITRSTIEEIGLHRPDFWIRGEDLEFSLRISESHQLVLQPAAVVQHLPPPEAGEISRAVEYLKHAAMVQNIAYLSLRLSHGRRIAWTLPANVWRFLRGWGPGALLDAFRALWRGGILAEPAGRGSGATFLARVKKIGTTSSPAP
jgi:GT2 family glycosyltransferase